MWDGTAVHSGGIKNLGLEVLEDWSGVPCAGTRTRMERGQRENNYILIRAVSEMRPFSGQLPS